MKEEKVISSHYGEGGRLKKAADPLLVNSAYAHDCNDADILLSSLATANIAHLLVLLKGKIIPLSEGQKILKGLLKIKEYKQKEFVLDPANGDIYNNFDVTLRGLIGEISGWLHTGRPRREAVNVSFLLELRKQFLVTIEASNNMLKALIKKSEEHQHTLMPDFTYLHHAQPTSFSHYILTFAFVLKRDLERMIEAFQRINTSWGESGSVNGSSLPIDKKYFAKLLGYKNISIHTRDAMWQPDIPLETMGVHISTLMNLTRFSEELQIWSTEEFGYISLPDSLCRASVIMPQKKNPYPLAYFRGLTNSMTPKFSEYAAHGRIVSGNPDSRIFIYGDLLKNMKKFCGGMNLLEKVITEMEVNVEKLRNKITNSDAYATDLADFLIMTQEINYREAHHIIGKINREFIAKGRKLNSLDNTFLKKIIFNHTGKKIKINKKDLKKIFDPREVVMSRKSLGGANTDQVKKMINALKKASRNNNKFIKSEQKNLIKGDVFLTQEINKYL